MARQLMPHQRRARSFVNANNGRAGLWMAPGTGKTIVALRCTPLPTLVICRRDDYLTWEVEVEEEEFPPGSLTIIESGNDNLPTALTDFTMVTYDLAKQARIYNWIRNTPFQGVILDEGHYIKSWRADRTKKVIRATRHIPCRLHLTGTPIGNDLVDVWAQAFFIDNGTTFGKKEFWFKRKYYLKAGPAWYPRKGAKEEIREKIPHIAFQVHEDDVLKLPPTRSIILAAPPTRAQRTYQRKILEQWEYELPSPSPANPAKRETVELKQVVTQLSKLRQVASGFLYRPDGTPHWFASGKIRLFRSLLNDHLKDTPKFVVWCAHRAEIDRIAEELEQVGKGVVTFIGGSRKDKERARKAFQSDPRIEAFVGQADSGVGMNELIVADTAVYFSNSFRVVSRQQSRRRIRRKGSEHHSCITYYDLVTEDSVDVSNLKALRRNVSVAHYVLDQLQHGTSIADSLNVG